jgi:Carboxypeptidase regulatory-like domain
MQRLLIALLGSLALGFGSTRTTAHAQQVVGGPSGDGTFTTFTGATTFSAPTGRQPGQVPPRDAQPSKPGTAVLRGLVMAADLGQPLRKAQIRLTSNGPSAPGQPPDNRLTNTDASGRYEFKEVRAGRYNVTASKAGGYITLSFGQQRPNEPGKPLEVLDGQTIEKIDFSLPRGGAITGRILDEFGDPLTDVQVTAARTQNQGGTRRLVPFGRAGTTNDIGEFRLFALPPGDYYLSATLRSQNGPVDTDDRSGYAPTYFPGTADVAAAQKLTVGLGQTINDLTFSLLPIRTSRVSGNAVDSQGRPMRGMVTAMLRTTGAVQFAGVNPGQVRPDGSFTINGLTPGDYTIQIQPQGPNGPDSEYATAEVTLSGSDVTGVQLVATKPSTVAGRVVVGAGDAQSPRPSTLRIGLQPVQNGGMVRGPFPAPVQVKDDWTFQTRARSGTMRVTTTGLQPPWTTKAVRYRGVDVTDTGIEVKPNEDLSDVEVELTNRITTVSGTVTNSRGEAVKEYWTVIFPRDREKWRSSPRYIRVSRSDTDGRYKVTGLPPTEYLAIALEVVDPGEASDPDFLDRIQNRATSLSLGEGDTKVLDLKLSPVQ